MMINLNKRYKLKKGKFGCYFYDSKVEIDLSLEMVLNRLNITDNRLSYQYNQNNAMTQEIYNLKDDIIELKNKLRNYEKP